MMTDTKKEHDDCSYCERLWTQFHIDRERGINGLVCDRHGLPWNQRAVCLYIVQDGHVLAVTRGHGPGSENDWGLPGGKVEETDVDDVKAAARELREETGYILDESSAIPIFTKKVHKYTCTTYAGRVTNRIEYDPREGVVAWVLPTTLLIPGSTFVDYNSELLRRIGALRYGS